MGADFRTACSPLTIRQSMRFGAMAVNGFVIEPVRVAATLVA
jgi:hypothetical protein